MAAGRGKVIATVKISPREVELTAGDLEDLLSEAAQAGALPMFSDLEDVASQLSEGQFEIELN